MQLPGGHQDHRSPCEARDEERPGRRRRKDRLGGTRLGACQVERTLQPLTIGASCGVAGPLSRAARAARHLSRGESGAEPGATREPGRVIVPNCLWHPGRQAPPCLSRVPLALLDPVAARCVARAQLSRSHRWPGRVPGVCVVGGLGGLVLCVRLSLLHLPPPRPRSPASTSQPCPSSGSPTRKVGKGVSLPR